MAGELNPALVLCVCCRHTDQPVTPDRLTPEPCPRCGQPCLNSGCGTLRPNAATGIYGIFTRILGRWRGVGQ